MKKLLLSAGIMASALLTMNTAKAQTNVLKVNILSPVVKTANFSYERTVSDNNSLQLGFFYTGFKVGDTKFSGIGITPEYRFYLSDDDAPSGFYVAPFVRYQNFNLSVPYSDFNPDTYEIRQYEATATLSTIGGGAIIGKHWIFAERISLDMFLGPSYNAGSIKVKDGAKESVFETGSFDGFGIRTGITLGVAF